MRGETHRKLWFRGLADLRGSVWICYLLRSQLWIFGEIGRLHFFEIEENRKRSSHCLDQRLDSLVTSTQAAFSFNQTPAALSKRLVMQMSLFHHQTSCPGTQSPQPKGFLLCYVLNCKAAVIWCNLGAINITLFYFPFAPSSFLLSLDDSAFTSGCLWEPAIRVLGAALLITTATTSGWVLGVRH